MVKLVVISDTHMNHDKIVIPECDILVHTGDSTNQGSKKEFDRFCEWFVAQPAEYKVLIAGNHDSCCEYGHRPIPKDIIYLQDTSITLRGIKIYGTPWTPRFYDYAFNADRGPVIAAKWAKIPNDTELLLVHGPPKGILDEGPGLFDDSMGCDDLLTRIKQLAKLKAVCFGHNHQSYGTEVVGNVQFINSAIAGLNRNPIEFYL